MNLEQKANLTAEARNKELDLRWTMTQLFFAVHSGLIAVFLYQLKEFGIGETGVVTAAILVGMIIGIIGIILSYMWLYATIRSQRLLTYWNERLAALELRLPDETSVFVTIDGKVPSPPGTPMDDLLVRLVSLFIISWWALFLISLIMFLDKGGLLCRMGIDS